jgi:uncharacterized protein YsxB (DUF464 family)
MNKTYIIYNDGKVGYIKDICHCDACKERKQTEIFINDLDGIYLDCVKLGNIEEIIYVGESLAKGIETLSEHYKRTIQTKEKEKDYLQNIIRLYENKLL